MSWTELKNRLDAEGMTEAFVRDTRVLMGQPLQRRSVAEGVAQVSVLRAIKDRLGGWHSHSGRNHACEDSLCLAWRAEL